MMEEKDTTTINGNYGAEQIQVLKGWKQIAVVRECTLAVLPPGDCII